jgi:hypothetical protein
MVSKFALKSVTLKALSTPLQEPFKKGVLLASIVLLAACITPVSYPGVQVSSSGATEILKMDETTRNSVSSLAAALRQLSPAISAQEATILARESHVYPMHLANVWQVTSPPLLNNVLRNYGKREYGLCIDWTYAMRQRMRGLGLSSFDWYWGIANEGSDLFEHSTLVATPKGAPFEQGIILDPWRNSGKLYWAKVGEDPKYKWKLYNEPEGWTPSRLNEGLNEE